MCSYADIYNLMSRMAKQKDSLGSQGLTSESFESQISNQQSFLALVISLFPGGPGRRSMRKPTAFIFRFTCPCAQ